MRTAGLIGTALLAAVAVAGCSATPAAPAAPAPVSSAATPGPGASVAAGFPAVPVAKADRVLVAAMSGTTAGRTPEFGVPDHRYTIRVACDGPGTLTVTPETTGQTVTCDGTPRRVHVATDLTRASVAIGVAGTARWTVAVVISPDFTGGSSA